MSKTVQDLKVEIEIEVIKTTQTDRILDIKNLGKLIVTTDTSITSKMKES